jgi:C4-dicarboxylate-specific signal transduction histidine kinase
MEPSPGDLFTLLEQAFDLTAAALRQTESPAERAARLAGVVRALWPAAPGALCRLTEDGRGHLRVLDQDGRAVSGPPSDSGEGDQAFPPPAPAGCRWILQEVGSPARAVLGLALPAEVAAEAEGPLRQLLAAYARELGLQLTAEAGARARADLEKALSEQDWMANLGTLAGPVTHEFNNYLNVILLQVAMLEQELAGKRRGELTVIRQQGKSVAELVRQWQQYRYRQPPALQAVDLNRVVRQVTEALDREPPAFGELRIRLAPAGGAGPPEAEVPGVWVRLALDAQLPPVSATVADLQRLVRFLVMNAAAAIMSAPGLVTVQTQAADGKVLLRVEDNGPPVEPARLAEFFEPTVALREGANRLELATAKTLAYRRLQGAIQAENRPEGGVAVTVTLRPWG